MKFNSPLTIETTTFLLMAEIVYSLKLFTVIELIDGHNERGF